MFWFWRFCAHTRAHNTLETLLDESEEALNRVMTGQPDVREGACK